MTNHSRALLTESAPNNCLQPTAYSVRSFLAPASGSG